MIIALYRMLFIYAGPENMVNILC